MKKWGKERGMEIMEKYKEERKRNEGNRLSKKAGE